MKPSILTASEKPISTEQAGETLPEPAASPTLDRAIKRRLPEHEGDNVEEFIEAYPYMFKE